MFKYQELIDKLQVEDINSAIKRMVDNYNLTGKYYGKDEDDIMFVVHRELFFEKYCSLSPDFLKHIENVIQKELNELYKVGRKNISLEYIDFDLLDSSTPEEDLKKKIKDKIYCSLLDYFESKAKNILDNREYLRIPIGSSVDFKECMLFNKYLGKVEFYKDGGWGIAEEDGLVIVKNHMVRQPSKTRSLLDGLSYLSNDIRISCPYHIIQDRDTGKYGILSYDSFYETVHCLYEEIEVDYNYSEHHFFIKAKKKGKWGCFDEKCALIIDFKYDDISLNGGYLECTKDAEHLPHGTTGVNVDEKYLYDRDGTLMIGGYDNLICDYGYFKIYFGTFYEYYPVTEYDKYENLYGENGERLNYERSICLVLDKNFKTVIRNKNGFFRMRKGQIFRSLTEVEQQVPSEFLLNHQVDLSDLHEGFIYLKDFKFKGEHICKDKSVITILKLNENKEIVWTEYANAILESDYDIHIYRKGTKYGFFYETGLKTAIYDAISRETPDGKIYVAVFENRKDSSTLYPDNPNYDNYRGLFIRYYTLETNWKLVRVEDNWDVFDPRDSEWYPYDFIASNYRNDDEA